MIGTLGEWVAGFVAGGLALSTAWGFFWLGIGLVGVSRNTCGWPIVLKGGVGGGVPLVLAIALVWWMGAAGTLSTVFLLGLMGMPVILVALWLRPMPDGRRAGTHLVAGVHHLMDELLGRHQGCGGCHDGHDHGTCG